MKIFIIGEAWGEHEERQRTAFVGTSGMLLTRMLADAGINRSDCFLTNVFNFRPANNNIDLVCGGKDEAIFGYPKFSAAGYVRREFTCELTRLASELNQHKPNIVICVGNTAMWAMLGKNTITKFRGTTFISTHTYRGLKVLPTYHPEAVRKNWLLRSTVIFDLIKAKRESEHANIIRPHREIWIEPTISDLETFYREHISTCKLLACDIETVGSQITTFGVSPRADLALVVPFVDHRRKDRNFWPTSRDERAAWDFVRRVCEVDPPRKCFQNGMYDISFIWRTTGIKVLGAEHDTMLMHHALQPESLKNLGYLGSIYTDEGSWKHIRTKTIKQDA